MKKEQTIRNDQNDNVISNCKGIDNDTKNKVDALQTLVSYWWGEYQEKTKLEWKICIALWTILVAAIGSWLTKDGHVLRELTGSYVLVIIVIIFCLHLIFLFWIQTRLRAFRKELEKIKKQIYNLLELQIEDSNVFIFSVLQPTLLIQILITLVLSLSLYFTINANV